MDIQLLRVKNYLLALFCGFLFFSDNYAQILESIEELDARNSKNITELLYIHTDREVYNPGDSIWFKAYIRNKASLYKSGFSKNFYLAIHDKEGYIVQDGKYLISDSQAKGQLTLKDNITEGVYFLAGYSSWMKNFSPDGVYSKKIIIRNEKREGFQLIAKYDKNSYFPGDTIKILINCYDQFNQEVTDVSFTYRILNGYSVAKRGRMQTGDSRKEALEYTIPDGLNEPPRLQLNSNYMRYELDVTYMLPVRFLVRVNFFPEGGHCINGIETRMAFKAESENGDPVDIAGDIIDSSGNVVHNISSEHDGMGSFSYFPLEGQPRFFRLTEPRRFSQDYPLPAGQNTGWQLSARSKGCQNEILVKQRFTNEDTALITVIVRDYLCYYKMIHVGKTTSLEVPINEIPPGIAVITLFNKHMIPVAKRLIFNPPERTVSASLETDRNTYVPRDPVNLQLHLNSEIQAAGKGSYSLSIIDEQICSSDWLDESNIKSSFLVSTEIKGKIHHPNYYTRTDDKNVRENLNLLLLTQGWRNYSYIMKPAAGSIGKLVNQDIISGKIMRQPWARNLAPTKGEVTVFFGGNITKLPVGEDGRFSFMPLYDTTTNNGILIYGKDHRGRFKVSIQLDSTQFDRQISSCLRKNAIKQSTTLPPLVDYISISDHFPLGLESHEWIEEVVVKKLAPKVMDRISDRATDKKVATKEDLDRAHDFEHLLELMGRSNYAHEPTLIVLDDWYTCPRCFLGSPGETTDPLAAYGYRPDDFAEFIVMRGPELQALYCPCIERVIEVRTKRYMGIPLDTWWVNPIIIGKFTVIKEFYVPQYDTESKRRSVLPDMRKTIHWDPDLEFSDQGTAQVKFYNGDRYTKIKCILEGITDEGVPVHAEHFYNVSLQRDDQ